MRDLRFAFRTLFRSPFVTAVAILSLALGIGANAATFSLFNQFVLRPLPVHEPEELVNLQAPGPKPGAQSCNDAGNCRVVFSYPMYRDLEREQEALAGLAAHWLFGANLAYRGQTISTTGTMVSGSYFGLLGLQPAIGRLLSPGEDEPIGGHSVAVLGHEFWVRQLGADPDVLNETIIINGHPMTIIGVAPPGFHGTVINNRPSVFVPIAMRAQVEPGFTRFDDRRAYWVYVFGRLRPRSTIEEAAPALQVLYSRILNEVEAPLQEGMSQQTLSEFRSRELVVEPGQRGQSSLLGQASTPLLLLFAITGTVLLIACANIANLLLSRAAIRSTEMAVRLSLGASRRHVVRQLLVESLLLAALGGAASFVVARCTLTGLRALLPAGAVNAMQPGTIDGQVVLFVGAVVIGAGLLSGLFPALRATRPDLIATLRSGSGQAGSARSAARFRTSLATAQIALSMALLISAGLFVKSLANVSRIDLGIHADNVVTFAISPELSGYDTVQSHQLFERLERELAAVPGVSGVTAAMVPILTGSSWGENVFVEGFEQGPDVDANSRYNEVGPGHFRTMRVPLLAGREFTDADALGSSRVAIVNEAFARKFGLGREAVGKRMAIRSGDSLDVQIVGLVQDARYSEVKREVQPMFYTPYRQDGWIRTMYYYARTALPADQVIRQVRPLVSRLAPSVPVEELKTLPQQIRETIFIDRMISTMAAAFAVLATVLAAVGLYGVLAYGVAQRTREIGLRMALGADRRRVRAMIVRQVAIMLLVGGSVGIAGALALGRAAASLLYGLNGNDPLVIGGAAVLLSLVALGAGYVPALRASRVDPMQALRYE